MGSLHYLFLKNVRIRTNICSIQDGLNKPDDAFHNIALSFNALCVLLFSTYYIELKREHWCVENLDINHDYPDNHLDDIIDKKPELKLQLRKHNLDTLNLLL